MQKVDYFLVISLSILVSIGILVVGIPSFTPLDVKTVTKVSELYEEPIFLTFHWITADEIQVGNLITLDIEIRNLPYNSNMMLENISIRFYEEQLNFWSFEGDSKNNEILQNDSVILNPDWNKSVFGSEKLYLRFIIPTDISAEYCDFNLKSPCTEIQNIIHPAPYDLKSRIDANRIVVILSLVTAALSSIVVWSRIRKDRPQIL